MANAISMKDGGWKKIKVTATGTVPKIGAGSIFGGLIMTVAGTSTTVTLYDDTTAAAGNLIGPTSAALTAGQFVNPFGSVNPITSTPFIGDGLKLDKGLHIVVGGTGSPTFWVLYRN